MSKELSQSREDAENKPALKHIVDEATGEVVEVDEPFRYAANTIQQRIEGATIVTAVLIQIVRDEKFYLAFGCDSFKEYADTMLPFNRRQAYKYINIAESFAPLLPKVDSKSVQSTAQIGEEIASNETVQALGELGTEKLYELTKMPEADFKEIMSRDVVTLKDGTEWSVEDIKSESARRVAEKVKTYKERNANLQESAKKAKSERDGYKEEIEKKQAELEDKQADLDRHKELDQKYSEQDTSIQRIYDGIDEAAYYLRKVNAYFGPLSTDDIKGEVPEALCQEVHSFMEKLTSMQKRAMMRFPFLVNMDRQDAVPDRLKAEEDLPRWLQAADPDKLGQPEGPNKNLRSILKNGH